MRPFAKPTPLTALSLEARVLYTAFIVFLLAGIWSAMWLSRDSGIALSSSQVATYYRGDAPVPAPAPTATTGGPALDLPSDAAQEQQIHVEKSARQVIETFHFHMFSVPVCLLIVGHLFMMCRWSTRTKAWLLAIASLATMTHVFGPLLVRFVSSAFAPVFVASAIVMALTWTVMLAAPLLEMWRRPA